MPFWWRNVRSCWGKGESVCTPNIGSKPINMLLLDCNFHISLFKKNWDTFLKLLHMADPWLLPKHLILYQYEMSLFPRYFAIIAVLQRLFPKTALHKDLTRRKYRKSWGDAQASWQVRQQMTEEWTGNKCPSNHGWCMFAAACDEHTSTASHSPTKTSKLTPCFV